MGFNFSAGFDWILAGTEQDTEERENSSDGDGIDLSSAMANARANLAAGTNLPFGVRLSLHSCRVSSKEVQGQHLNLNMVRVFVFKLSDDRIDHKFLWNRGLECSDG